MSYQGGTEELNSESEYVLGLRIRIQEECFFENKGDALLPEIHL